MLLASSKEIESNETIVLVDGDRVSDLVREGKIKLCLYQILIGHLVIGNGSHVKKNKIYFN